MKVLHIMALVPTLALATAHDTGDGEFAWLVGCWVTADNSAQEVWVAQKDGSLAGFAVTIRGNKIGFYEVMSIKQSNDGGWTFTAHPAGQESASFHAAKVGENSVVFANPDHDYPQEIRYRREGIRLFASISLLGGVNPNSFDKVACE